MGKHLVYGFRARALVVATCLAVIGACDGGGGGSKPPPARGITFAGVDAPETDAEKRAVRVSSTATVDGETHDIGFHAILRSGQRAGDGIFGLLFDHEGEVVRLSDGAPWISNANDFSSLLTGADGRLYMVSHFEESPGGMYVTELSQERATGELSAVRTRSIDFSHLGGGWVHCAGSVTPWGTHLGSEEYEPDARDVDPTTGALPSYGNAQALYFGLAPDLTGAGAYAGIDAHRYGWEIEVEVDDFETVTATKRYAMGRLAHEMAKVMPDRKTAYIADDGTNVGLYRFVADTAGDLSAGRLYAARWTQKSAEHGGSADLTWVDLGHATETEIAAYLDGGTSFADIFDTATPNADGTCPAGFSATNVGHDINATGLECLKIREGMTLAASRLETRRYAALMGGTTEFRKMEGITHDPGRNVLYIAMSEVNNGMLDGHAKADKGGPNHIRLPMNTCGVVYALTLDASFVASEMHGVLQGVPRVVSYGAAADDPYPANGAFAKNKCDLDGISNPDNISFMPGYDTLLVGEDTGDGHQNDAVWAYDVVAGELTRIETTPYGAETTGVYFYPNVNGWAYVMSVVQHPYGESDTDKSVPGSEETKAYTGYIGPLPAMD